MPVAGRRARTARAAVLAVSQHVLADGLGGLNVWLLSSPVRGPGEPVTLGGHEISAAIPVAVA